MTFDEFRATCRTDDTHADDWHREYLGQLRIYACRCGGMVFYRAQHREPGCRDPVPPWTSSLLDAEWDLFRWAVENDYGVAYDKLTGRIPV